MRGNGKKAHATRRAADHIRHLHGQVRDHLIKAAAAMINPSPENKGIALYYATLATIRLAESDPDNTAADFCISVVRSGQPPRVPGPYSST